MTRLAFFSALDRALFPHCCAVCAALLSAAERVLCNPCRRSLSYFDNASLTDNEIMDVLGTVLPLRYATALLDYHKTGPTQRLIHQLKYRRRAEISAVLGAWLAPRLRETALVHYDCVIPVPLHRKRLKKRGYNQVSGFARTLATELGLRACESQLVRLRDNDTQTRKSRLARQLNVKQVFAVPDPTALQAKKILLVDDVMTTGATLRACAEELLRAGALELSVAVMAVAQ